MSDRDWLTRKRRRVWLPLACEWAIELSEFNRTSLAHACSRAVENQELCYVQLQPCTHHIE